MPLVKLPYEVWYYIASFIPTESFFPYLVLSRPFRDSGLARLYHRLNIADPPSPKEAQRLRALRSVYSIPLTHVFYS